MTPNGECQIIGPDRSQIFDAGVNFLSLRHPSLIPDQGRVHTRRVSSFVTARVWVLRSSRCVLCFSMSASKVTTQSPSTSQSGHGTSHGARFQRLELHRQSQNAWCTTREADSHRRGFGDQIHRFSRSSCSLQLIHTGCDPRRGLSATQ